MDTTVYRSLLKHDITEVDKNFSAVLEDFWNVEKMNRVNTEVLESVEHKSSG